MGAKLVGRYASGCPLEQRKDQPDPYVPTAVDPGRAAPNLGSSDLVNNHFEYGKDPMGMNVPRGAHIRKAYPRDQVGTVQNGSDSESRTQTHRLLRRGIPFGASLGAAANGAADAAFPHDRGLLFLCYQTDLERQFEFVQQTWINAADFPCRERAGIQAGGQPLYPNGTNGPDGEDPVIAQTAQGPYAIPTQGNAVSRLPDLKHFVTMTGGDYFFQPSIAALYALARVSPPA